MDKMRYEEIGTLQRFFADVEKELLNADNHLPINYPSKARSKWDEDAIASANEEILEEVSCAANVYAIFTAPKNSEHFRLRYIGKTTRELARQRIRNHLIKKSDRTGAQLVKLKAHVQSGGNVKISWVQIEPETLRGYVEEELILRHEEADWNRENSPRSIQIRKKK